MRGREKQAQARKRRRGVRDSDVTTVEGDTGGKQKTGGGGEGEGEDTEQQIHRSRSSPKGHDPSRAREASLLRSLCKSDLSALPERAPLGSRLGWALESWSPPGGTPDSSLSAGGVLPSFPAMAPRLPGSWPVFQEKT